MKPFKTTIQRATDLGAYLVGFTQGKQCRYSLSHWEPIPQKRGREWELACTEEITLTERSSTIKLSDCSSPGFGNICIILHCIYLDSFNLIKNSQVKKQMLNQISQSSVCFLGDRLSRRLHHVLISLRFVKWIVIISLRKKIYTPFELKFILTKEQEMLLCGVECLISCFIEA